MDIRHVGLVLFVGCAFGVDGDFAVTEAGLVGVESLSLEEGGFEAMHVSSTSSDGTDLVVSFGRGTGYGELRIRNLRDAIEGRGEGTLHHHGVHGWSAPRRVELTVASVTPASRWNGSGRAAEFFVIDLLEAEPRATRMALVAAEGPDEAGVTDADVVEHAGTLILSVTDGHCPLDG